jgi:hypothetical protein
LVTVAVITALSVIPFLGMAPEAGNAVSGYRLQPAEEAAAAKPD